MPKNVTSEKTEAERLVNNLFESLNINSKEQVKAQLAAELEPYLSKSTTDNELLLKVFSSSVVYEEQIIGNKSDSSIVTKLNELYKKEVTINTNSNDKPDPHAPKSEAPEVNPTLFFGHPLNALLYGFSFRDTKVPPMSEDKLDDLAKHWPLESFISQLELLLKTIKKEQKAEREFTQEETKLIAAAEGSIRTNSGKLPANQKFDLITRLLERPKDYPNPSRLILNICKENLSNLNNLVIVALNGKQTQFMLLEERLTALINECKTETPGDLKAVQTLVIIFALSKKVGRNVVRQLIEKKPDIKSDLLGLIKKYIVDNKDMDPIDKQSFLSGINPEKKKYDSNLLLKILSYHESSIKQKSRYPTKSINNLIRLINEANQSISKYQLVDTSVKDIQAMLDIYISGYVAEQLFQYLSTIENNEIVGLFLKMKPISIDFDDLKSFISYAEEAKMRNHLIKILPLLKLNPKDSNNITIIESQAREQISRMVRKDYKKDMLKFLKENINNNKNLSSTEKEKVLREFLLDENSSNNVAVLLINKRQHRTTDTFFNNTKPTSSQSEISGWINEIKSSKPEDEPEQELKEFPSSTTKGPSQN